MTQRLITHLRHVDLAVPDFGKQLDFYSGIWGLTPEHTDFNALRDEFLQRYQQELGRHARPFPGISSLLDWLDAEGLPWGVVTNKMSCFSIPLLEAVGLAERCASLVCPDQVSQGKPHPEPLFKAYCTSYGRNLHTGIFLHWVLGRGRIEVGDDVVIEGKCSFIFAARYSPSPTLKIGDRTGMEHNCTFTVGKSITIGDDVQMGPNVQLLTATHPIDAAERASGWELAGPIAIGSGSWLGGGVIVGPGVTVGERTVVGAGAVVVRDLPADVVAVGNPARVIRRLA